ncbi:hypothetical protein NAT51_13580 [Flavobacterium amniphilum]|uniref:hypothetical protein n=1 Tax=Flavobacterium amniphilum TaxID=1834035 RepID=UPI00202A0D0C|nr:hypothetical protein [Flavobacterium amniphilum]MCL9806561.1 hypothetical protein [Flavobacterium amniphilum]
MQQNNKGFKKVTLEEECNGMRCEYETTSYQNSYMTDILLVRFNGEYRPGSMGKPDLGYMAGMVKLGINVWDPFKVAIDIQNVTYEWGDDMELLFDAPDHLKTVVIVGENNRRAISTLMLGIDTEEDIVDNKFFFDDFEAAIEKLKKMK